MYLIAHQSGINRWVSGIFKSRNSAIDYLDLIPQVERPSLLEFTYNDYPVYLLETHGSEFTLYDRTEITAYINNLTVQDDDDYFYGNIYRIDRDWRSSKIGKDRMGLIPHIHIHNEQIASIKDVGIANYF
jgi:hypothetical protein